MKNKKMVNKIIATTLSMLFTINIIDIGIKVKADENNVEISLKPQYKADVVLTVEDSIVNPENFEKDLKTKLSELGVKDSRIKVTGLNSKEISAEDSFAWNIYDHKGNFGEINYPNGDGQKDPKDNQHIIVKDSGKNIVFYGYGKPAYKDFMFMKNDSTSQKTFEFEIDETNIKYHSMEGGGFLFNSKIENNKLSGYSILFTEEGVNLYEIDSIDIDAFHDSDYEVMSSYPGITMLSSVAKDASPNHKIKIEVDEDKISMWDNGKESINKYSLKTKYGNSFGPIASYDSHNCSILSYFTFKNLTMKTTNITKFKDLIRQPKWDINSKRFVVNLNDTSDKDFLNPSTFAEIQSRLASEDINYIGWGTSNNKTEAEDLIKKNNNNGIFVDNKDYSDSINKIANYIVEKLKQTSSGETKVIVGQPMDIDVNPASLKKNTANNDFPIGGWKLDHDSNYYENNMGQATFDGQYMDSLNMIFEKTGKYNITFRDNIVSPNVVYAHRLPIANFDATVKNNNENYTVDINETSYDEDNKSAPDKGIVEKYWEWRELTSSEWKIGQIPNGLEKDKQYLIKLKVKDSDGAFSTPLVKYISTKEDVNEKPIASFILTPETLYAPVMEVVGILNNSYDPQGETITEEVWTVEKDGKEIYNGTTPKTNYKGLAAGEYIVSLKVKTSIWSEKYSRVFNIKDTKGEADKASGDVTIGYAEGDNANSVTQNVTLPSIGTNNTLVRWSSSDDKIIDKYGKVIRPEFLEGDKIVDLKATLYNNGSTSTKDFKLTVKAKKNNIPTIKDGEKIGYINKIITFTDIDFTANYSDSEGSEEKLIKIVAVPENGKLLYNDKEVKANDEIQISDINKLTFMPNEDFVGKAELTYKANDGFDYSLDGKLNINIQDNIPTVVSNVSITSNNEIDSKYAKAGDTITLSFTSSKELGEEPKITILGHEATVTKALDNSYKATLKVLESDTQGVATFVIGQLKDKYNNKSEEIMKTTDESSVIVDTIAPVVSGPSEDGYYKPGIVVNSNEGKMYLNNSDINSGDSVTVEGNHKVVATDKAGNVTSVNFVVDGTAPIFTDVKDNTYYNKEVAPKFNEGTALINGKEFISGTVLAEEGPYKIIAVDKAGNGSMVTFIIDKTPPMIKEVIENGEYNRDVNPTFNEGTATLEGIAFNSGDTISKEGKHTIVAIDNAGNKSELTFIIDKTAPIITGAKDGGIYNTDITLGFNEGTGSLDGKYVSSGVLVESEGEHRITVIDGAGNISTLSFVIDKTAPIITGIDDGKFYNNKVVINFNEGKALLNGVEFNNGSEVKEDGIYKIVVTDKAGNTTIKTFTIDKTAPIISKVKDGETYKENVAPEFNEGKATLNGKPYMSGTAITEDGNYTLVVTDEAGNKSEVTFTIDKSMPKTLNLRGTVHSKDGVVENANLTLADINGKTIETTTSDKDGNYSFNNQKLGLYKIKATKDSAVQSIDVNLNPSKPTDKELVVDIYISKYKVVITAEPNSIVGDGLDKTIIKVTVYDENNKIVPDKTVTLEVTSGTLLNGNKVITDKNGNAVFTLQSSKITGDDMLTVTVSAKVEGLDVPVENNAIIHFAPGAINGVVIDNETGTPVEGALIEVSKDFDNNGITDFYVKFTTGKDGKYKIAIPKGNIEYDVKITKKMKIGNIEKQITFNQKTRAGVVTSSGNESYSAANTVTGLLLMKSPEGEVRTIKDYSNYNIVILDENGKMVSNLEGQNKLEENGSFNFNGLEKGKTYYTAIYYNLPNGSKIKVGSSKIIVNNDGELNIATCLIDPYGDVTDKETGKLLAGASVKLYYANTARNLAKGIKPGTLVDLPKVSDFPPADNLNPQISDENGKYAWMVFPETDYYIVATVEGYEKYTSNTISVDNEIVRHDIQMTPIKTQNNGVGTDQKENNGVLPNTGSKFDSNILVVLGLILCSSGIIIYRRKAKKTSL